MSLLKSLIHPNSYPPRVAFLGSLIGIAFLFLTTVYAGNRDPIAKTEFDGGPAVTADPAPLTEEDIAVRLILDESQKKTADLQKTLAATLDFAACRKIEEEIAAIKKATEIRVLETYLEFADRENNPERVQELLKRIQELQVVSESKPVIPTDRPRDEFPDRDPITSEEAGR